MLQVSPATRKSMLLTLTYLKEHVVNEEFGATIEDWVADFWSSEDRPGYDRFYKLEEYQKIVEAIRLLDPHLTEYKARTSPDRGPGGVLVYSITGLETRSADAQGRLAVGRYDFRTVTGVSRNRTVENAVTLFIKKRDGGYVSDRSISPIFLHELLHHLQM